MTVSDIIGVRDQFRWRGGGGAKVSCPNIFSIACQKIKWFCPNETRLCPKMASYKIQGGGGDCKYYLVAPTPTPPRTHMVSNDAERPNVYIFSVNVILIINRRKVLLFDNFPVSFSCHALELSLATQTLLL